MPDSNIFHDDIAWLADAEVTKGCNPPANDEFCPGDNVRRETMAAFMHRLAVNQVVDAKTAITAESADEAAMADDADMLDGMDSTDFVAATDAPYITGDTAEFGSTSVTGVSKIEEISVSNSSDGYLLITGNSVWNNAGVNVLTWLQLDNTTCSNAVGVVTTIAYGYAQTGDYAWDSVSITGTIAASSGAHTVTQCANPFAGAASPRLVGASIQALFVADGSVTTNLAGNSAGGGSGGLSN